MDCKMNIMCYHVSMDNIDAIAGTEMKKCRVSSSLHLLTNIHKNKMKETLGTQSLAAFTPTPPVSLQPILTVATAITTTRTKTYNTTTNCDSNYSCYINNTQNTNTQKKLLHTATITAQETAKTKEL